MNKVASISIKQLIQQIILDVCVHMYIYIYIYMCVCVCMYNKFHKYCLYFSIRFELDNITEDTFIGISYESALILVRTYMEFMGRNIDALNIKM